MPRRRKRIASHGKLDFKAQRLLYVDLARDKISKIQANISQYSAYRGYFRGNRRTLRFIDTVIRGERRNLARTRLQLKEHLRKNAYYRKIGRI